MPRVAGKVSSLGTIVVSIVFAVAILILLMVAYSTLATTAATSSNDMGLMLLRIFGAVSVYVAIFLLLCAVYAFVTSYKESHLEFPNPGQASRFVIIGLAFVVVAIMVAVFGWAVHTFIL